MKYMLMIHQGTTPTPPSEEWERLSTTTGPTGSGAIQYPRQSSTKPTPTRQ